MTERNIQHLFLSIRLEQIRTYLTNLGWDEKITSVRRQFEKLDPQDQSLRSLILPLEESHPRFRSLVPNVVFSLAVFYEREAMDIAVEISEVQVQSATPTSALSVESKPDATSMIPCCFELHNAGTDDIHCSMSGLPIGLAIPPNETILLQAHPGKGRMRISTTGNVQLQVPPVWDVALSYGYPLQDFRMDSADELAFQIFTATDQWMNADPDESVLKKEISLLASRYLFSIESFGEANGAGHQVVVKGVAILLVSLSRKMSSNQKSATDLLLLARILFKPHGITFNYSADLADRLWIVCKEDDPEAPRSTMSILQRSVVMS